MRPGPERDPQPSYFDQLSATVEQLGAVRSALTSVISLADESPGLTDEQLTDRLVGLGERVARVAPGGSL